ncbi:chromosome partitioning protein ParB [Parabacteroides sp. AF48-14]|uniref:chromosome partitioning protein ParB n=1 Tax=Parabacteroides sp. AF48-14 TaxID=2292052 RepID=UPI001F1AEA70|nr:chromosome partitioning protein ParB [Parabacteroides sp. AF48-14]
MNESVDIFGNKASFIRPSLTARNKGKTLFDDYDGFVGKFEAKKTTDDCYTPAEVYNVVLNYVSEKCNIKGAEIVRPFFPGGDYENCDYPEGCVVVDNPPFSIISKIAKFYIENNIKFFLFAPHLTLFSPRMDYTRIVVGASIVYENGANVKTSFISNLFEDIIVMSDPDLYRKLERINEAKNVNLPKYVYPNEVLTVSAVQWCVERGVSCLLKKRDVYHVRGLDSQKTHKKAIFGSGYLLSEKAAAEKAAAEKAAAEKDNIIIWELSERERNIIKSLGK